MNEAMQKLIDAVQKASPVVWQAAYRQVWIDGIENALLLIAAILVGRFMWKFAQRLADDDADEAGVFFTRLGSIAAFATCIPFAIGLLDCFLNPTFAAIKELKSLL